MKNNFENIYNNNLTYTNKLYLKKRKKKNFVYLGLPCLFIILITLLIYILREIRNFKKKQIKDFHKMKIVTRWQKMCFLFATPNEFFLLNDNFENQGIII
jgi:hypothetical protein